MNRRGCGGKIGGRDGVRGYGIGGSPSNVNELDTNNSGGLYEGHQLGQGQGQGHGALQSGYKGGCNGTGFIRGAYH